MLILAFLSTAMSATSTPSVSAKVRDCGVATFYFILFILFTLFILFIFYLFIFQEKSLKLNRDSNLGSPDH